MEDFEADQGQDSERKETLSLQELRPALSSREERENQASLCQLKNHRFLS
jgi:hypothetical protein